MGTDYSQGHGYIIGIDDLVEVVSDDNRLVVITKIKSYFASPENIPDVLKSITEETSTDDLKATLIKMCDVSGEPGKYDGECYATIDWDTDELCDFFNEVLKWTDSPWFEQARIFDSYRKHEGCPIGVVSFVVDESTIYEKTLNDIGTTFEKLCGGFLNECEWTDVSY
ncbi:MAG: hypothetical protein HOB20_06235 [Planctomycetaceae bacterium]|jgi:hypothetical protein|nr:hypothetical protein [Planctomycetaceae bacterium]